MAVWLVKIVKVEEQFIVVEVASGVELRFQKARCLGGLAERHFEVLAY